MSKEETFRIPLKCVDVTKSTHTDLDVSQEKRCKNGNVYVRVLAQLEPATVSRAVCACKSTVTQD